MTSRQHSKLSMYLATKCFLLSNDAKLSISPNYISLFNDFKGEIIHIMALGQSQMFDKTGVISNKSLLKSALVLLAADTSRRLQAYAKFEGDTHLLYEIKYSDSDLNRASDEELRDLVHVIYARAQTLLPVLDYYGFSQGALTALLDALNLFVTALPRVVANSFELEQNAIELSNAFKATDHLLANLDSVIDHLRVAHPMIHSGYHKARLIVDTASESLALKGVVTDSNSGEPVKGVTVSFVPDGGMPFSRALNLRSPASVVKKSANMGGFNIRSLPTGIYQVTLKKSGYLEHYTRVRIMDGELSELNVAIEKY